MAVRWLIIVLLALTWACSWHAPVIAAPEGEKETPQPIDQDRRDALLELAAGRHDKALAAAERFLKRNPMSADAYSLRGLVHSAAEAFDKARADFDRALELDEKCVDAQLGNARLDLLEFEYEAARKRLDAALAVAPENLTALELYGDVELADGNYEAGAQHYSAVLKHKADSTAALFGRGCCYYNLEQYKQAALDLEAAVEFKSTLGKAWRVLGDVRRKQREWQLAEAAYYKALMWDAKRYATFVNLVLAHMAQKEFEQAVPVAREAIEHFPLRSTARSNLALCLSELGRHDEAEEEIRRALLCSDVDAADHRIHAEVLSRAGKKLDAAVAWQAAFKTANNAEFAAGYADALCDVHRYEAALRVLKDWPADDADIVEKRVLALVSLHRPSEAQEVLDEFGPGLNEHPGLLLAQGSVLDKLHRFDDLQAVANRLGKMYSQLKIAESTEAYILHSKGDLDGALKKLRSFEASAPFDSTRRWTLWALMCEHGNHAEVAVLQEAAISADNRADNLYRHAQVLTELGELDRAERQARAAIAADQWKTGAHIAYAGALLAGGKPGEAEQVLDRAVDINPYSIEVRLTRADALLRQKRERSAYEDVEAAYALNPLDVPVLVARAFLKCRRDLSADALSAIEEAEARVEWIKQQGVSGFNLALEIATLKLARASLSEDANQVAELKASAISTLKANSQSGRYLSPSIADSYWFESVREDATFKALWEK
jgi:tetratricopeptide (TPR) repeat protein